jgi:hypothetical protein
LNSFFTCVGKKEETERYDRDEEESGDKERNP